MKCILCEEEYEENDLIYVGNAYPWDDGHYCLDCEKRIHINPLGDDI